jgi:23S rRNA pseudouridine2605 synthase
MLTGATQPTRPAQISVRARSPLATDLEIIIHEGKKRQIRRMLLAVGSRVRRLLRVQIGPVALGALAPGETRRLDDEEITALAAAAGYVLRARDITSSA